MSNNEDLELQALQRQLDDAFETTRPRAAFEDELWSRMHARHPVRSRVSDFFTGLFDGVRQAPAVPAVAVAVLLIVAISVGVVSLSGNHLGGGGSTASLATRPEQGGAQFAGGAAAFGKLPVPALGPVPVEDVGPPKATSPQGALPPTGVIYMGPAKLVWVGRLSLQITSAPVFRYFEPTQLDADRFATGLGASPTTRVAGDLGDYSGDGFVLGVVGSRRQPPAEPTFYIRPDPSRLPAPGPTPVDTASAYLTTHNLIPTWPYVVTVSQYADYVVEYLRRFPVPGYGDANLVNAGGFPYGLGVHLKDGQPLLVSGALPLNLDTADYPIISADRAVSAAVVSSPSASASFASEPTVRLTTAELVYALVNAGDHSFYEPAFLFSGNFTLGGVTYTKRVLVPAVDPSQRSS